MGSLTLPPRGSVYLDTSAIIYSVERHVLAAPEVRLAATTRHLWEETARLRAATGLKTPDALHAATALQADCALFVTNDSDFRRVPGLPVVILDDLI